MAPLERDASNAAGPRNELESALAVAWEEVLGLPSVGVHDDFFDVGGHSLLAAALASRVSALLRVDFRARDVERHPTIASQAEAIVRALADHDPGGVVASVLRETKPPPALS